MSWIYFVGSFIYTFMLSFKNNEEKEFYAVFAKKLYEAKNQKSFNLNVAFLFDFLQDNDEQYLIESFTANAQPDNDIGINLIF